MRACPAVAEAKSELETSLESLHTASYGWALACMGRDPAEAADVLQLVYVKILAGKVRFEERSSFKTWLFGVIRLTALEQRRLRWFRHRHAPSDTVDVAVPASEPKVDRETAEALSRGMSALSSRQREALHLTFYEGLSISEAAAVMNVSLGTARLHYERGKAALLAQLAREGVNFP